MNLQYLLTLFIAYKSSKIFLPVDNLQPIANISMFFDIILEANDLTHVNAIDNKLFNADPTKIGTRFSVSMCRSAWCSSQQWQSGLASLWRHMIIMASQISDILNICSTPFEGLKQNITEWLCSVGSLYVGNKPLIGGFVCTNWGITAV